jgi:hypothetical protein
MSHKYAVGKKSYGFCDRCSQRFPLKDMRRIMIKDTLTQIMVCKQDWEASHPQLQQGKYPVFDPQALRNPRPDISYHQSGLATDGYPASGSRAIQWGWAPVGMAEGFDAALTPNRLVAVGHIGLFTVS